jgi:GTP-binding protein Era
VTQATPGESHAGSAALVGWTNVGKSSLLNRLIGEKIAAVAEAAQTTRRPIRGVLTLPGRGQVVLVDTPGLHRPRHALNRAMVELALQTVHAVELVLLVVDASRPFGPGDHEIAERLHASGAARLLVLNKIDVVQPKSRLLPLMRTADERWGFRDILPVSAATGEGCATLVETILTRLPGGPPLYPEDTLTDQTERTIASEMIRERLLALTRDELPHATAVLVDRWELRPDGLVEIAATILVERDSQKQIVIGRGGGLLKQVGSEARLSIEKLLGQRVFLRLWVKVRRGWRDDERTLEELGLSE